MGSERMRQGFEVSSNRSPGLLEVPPPAGIIYFIVAAVVYRACWKGLLQGGVFFLSD